MLVMVRMMIKKMPKQKKVEKLLQYIDANGIDKIRTVG